MTGGYVRVDTAARHLGVDAELLRGLMIGGQVGGVRAVGRSGRSVWLVAYAELDRLAALLADGVGG